MKPAERIVCKSTMVDQRGGDAVEDSATLQCTTPRQIVSRWVKKLRHKSKKTTDVNRNRVEKTLTSLGAVERVEIETPRQESGVSGQQEEMRSFELAAGVGLALVVAASKNELDKMKELRKQMEMIVEEAKEELRCKCSVPCHSLRTCEKNSYSTTNIDVDESISFNERVSDPSCIGSRSSPYSGMKDESPYIELDDQEWCRGRCNEGRGVSDGMAQLETELEAELQLLALKLDSADISRDNQDVVLDFSDGGCETLGYDEEVDYANDPKENISEAQYGSVPPRELERRLHELLEAQQLERIKELEAELEQTKQKLKKKEVEACWWKETSHLISQHVSQTAPRNISPPNDQTRENFR